MMKLFMLLLGGKPAGRHTEQHDIFFGIAENLAELVPAIERYWPEIASRFHIDAWREVKNVDGYDVRIESRDEGRPWGNGPQLFFLNLGGYKPGEFEEYHYKMVTVAASVDEASAIAKKTLFFKHTQSLNGSPHIDDKYGIDVDDIAPVEDLLDRESRDRYHVVLVKSADGASDPLNIGYLKKSMIQG